MEYIVIGLVGALAALLANQSIAVFNDGLRPIVPQFLEGKMSRAALASTSFAMGFGLVIGFGIPVSIGASIILIHSILLMTDIIGTSIPSGKTGMIISAVVGALWGILLVAGLEFIVNAFAKLPYDFTGSLSMISAPVVVAFSLFPAVAITFQHGFKKGVIAFGVQFLTLVLLLRFGTFTVSTYTIKLSAEGITLLVGMALMIFFAVQIKGDGNSNSALVSLFAEKVKRIRKNWYLLALMGGLISAATSLLIIAGDPISLNLMSTGDYNSAAFTAVARAIGFVPLVMSTAIVSGVYGPAGTTLVFAIGISLAKLVNDNPIFIVLAFVLGALALIVEIFLLESAAKGLDKFPGIRDMGEHIRTSMTKVLELALLVGSAMAANVMAPGLGFVFVFGLYLINKKAPKPLVDMAVGPVAVIALGILLNILLILNLWVAPVVG